MAASTPRDVSTQRDDVEAVRRRRRNCRASGPCAAVNYGWRLEDIRAVRCLSAPLAMRSPRRRRAPHDAYGREQVGGSTAAGRVDSRRTAGPEGSTAPRIATRA